MILTVDLGTSATKVMVWGEGGPLASGRAEVETRFGGGGRVEQDPADWWSSIVDAADAALGAAGPSASAGVDAVCFAAARQSFVPVSAAGRPIGPGIVWSDRRAAPEARALAEAAGGAEAVRQATGMVLDGAAMSAKIAWLARHEPARLSRARWLLSPRDLAVWRMTGVVCSDRTLASATGLYDASGEARPDLAGAGAGLLAEVVASTTVAGALAGAPAAALGLRAGIPVVVGAGDRACEVLGTGAAAGLPMVAWGTTANVSVPAGTRPDPVPAGVVVTRGALEGWVVEGGLSAAGSLLAWLARVSGTDVDALVARARASPPGARGVTATPWLGGARAPWWRDAARAGFVGIGFEHDAGDLTRAAVEAVAYDVTRCLESLADGPGWVPPAALAASGEETKVDLWADVLAQVSGLPVRRRRWGEAAAAGAALIGAAALGARLELDRLDPVAGQSEPDPALVARYRGLRRRSDQVAEAVVDLGDDPA